MLLKRKYLFGTTILAGVMAVTAPAFAQTAPQSTPPANQQTPAQAADEQEEADVLEEVIVTGSRIPRPQYDGTIPGAQVDRETIETRGFTNAIEILNDLPITGPAVVLATGTGTPGNAGSSYVDLLDLGSARTLTLVNGRRFVSNNAGTIFVAGNETGSQVDASTIPGALIERVDVLTVGGAAAYGSDAIAGVINYILRDDFEGLDVRATVSGYEGGQGETYSLGITTGKNFFDDRLNITLSGDVSRLEALYSRDFDFLANNIGLFGQPLSTRNPAFVFGGPVSGTGGIPTFLAANADGRPGAVPIFGFRTYGALPGGTILLPSAAYAARFAEFTNGQTAGLAESAPNRSPAQTDATFYSGGFLPSTPSFCNGGALIASTAQTAAAANPRVCSFAPSALPGTTAAQQNANAARVFAAYGVATPTLLPGESAAAFQARSNSIALGILQTQNPTVREYFQQNPTLDPRLFLASFTQGMPFLASGNPLLPRIAAPIRFDSNGNVVPFNIGTFGPEDPAGFGNAIGDDPDLFNATDRAVQRIQQERVILNLNARFDITDNIQFFTENLFSKIDIVTPNQAGNAFSTSGGAVETSGIVVGVNHPFLTNQNRTDLAARGITSSFVLSTDYFDIFKNGNPATATSETFRSVNGFRGDFDLLGRSFNWDVAYAYSGSDYQYQVRNIRDAEFILAIDAIDVGGTTRCRVNTPSGAGLIGTSPQGLFTNVVRTTTNLAGGPAFDVPRDQNFQPIITAEMAAGCQPLNLFGTGRASQAAIDYVTFEDVITNEARQEYLQGTLSGEIVNLWAGPLQFAVSGELRRESLLYGAGELSSLARGRSAPSAATDAEIKTEEYGLEFRVPLVSPEMNVPLVHSLEFSPAYRISKQSGSAAPFRNVSGTLIEPENSGEFEDIYSFAMTYSPIADISFRANVSRAVRQPDIVSLFLGSQPAFINASNDVCGSTLIDTQPAGVPRRANCETLVRQVNPIAPTLGNTRVIDPTLTDAQNLDRIRIFLNSYGAANPSFQTVVAGDVNLRAEIADSYTWGVVLQPRFIPNFTLSADLLKITVKGLVSTLTTPTAAQFCLDSPTFPDTRPQVGLDLCPNVIRDSGTFRITNGSLSGFWNQGAVEVEALNINGSYGFDVSELLGDGQEDLGRVGIRTQIYKLLDYASSPDGTFNPLNTSFSDGTLGRPEWEVQLVGNYSRGPVRLSWTGNWQSEGQVFSGLGRTPATIDQVNITTRFPSFWIHSATVGYDISEEASVQFIVNNVFDTVYPSVIYEQAQASQSLGRTLRAQLIYKF